MFPQNAQNNIVLSAFFNSLETHRKCAVNIPGMYRKYTGYVPKSYRIRIELKTCNQFLENIPKTC